MREREGCRLQGASDPNSPPLPGQSQGELVTREAALGVLVVEPQRPAELDLKADGVGGRSGRIGHPPG